MDTLATALQVPFRPGRLSQTWVGFNMYTMKVQAITTRLASRLHVALATVSKRQPALSTHGPNLLDDASGIRSQGNDQLYPQGNQQMCLLRVRTFRVRCQKSRR